LLASSLEPEHLDFHRIGSWRKTVEFVCARLVRGGHRAVFALGRDYSCSRQWLAAEFHDSGGCKRRLSVERRSQSDKQIKPEH
jgi:hypothetical protein